MSRRHLHWPLVFGSVIAAVAVALAVSSCFHVEPTYGEWVAMGLDDGPYSVRAYGETAGNPIHPDKDGSLCAWGNNENGHLGDGTTTERLVPTRLGFDSDWTAIDGDWGNSAALKKDGSLWVWDVGHRTTRSVDSCQDLVALREDRTQKARKTGPFIW